MKIDVWSILMSGFIMLKAKVSPTLGKDISTVWAKGSNAQVTYSCNLKNNIKLGNKPEIIYK